MNRCPITYEPCRNAKYSERGLKLLSRSLKTLEDLPFSAQEQRREAVARAAKMSIQGVQPKLSVRLNVKRSAFEITDIGGEFIIKPQTELYTQLPENEDLTMKLAAIAGIEMPLHGLVYSKDGSLSYFIKRFDRFKKGKLSVEDFAQLAGKTRETKYDFSMEKVAKIIEEFCTFPAIEKAKFFKLTLFNFLTGNEDMHLKNFSLITRENVITLTPAYDLINTTIAMPNAEEELALPLLGKKSNITRKLLVDYFARERLGLNEKIIEKTFTDISAGFARWDELIAASFLKEDTKEKYKDLLAGRKVRMKM